MIAQRKRPGIRVGPRLAGFPPDEPAVVPTPAPAPSSVAQTQATLINLLEAVDAVKGINNKDTDEKVRQVVRETLSPSTPATPVKRGRGRPRKYAGETVQERERNRKRNERWKANLRLTQLLRHFELEVTSQIPPGLKTKYGLEVNTYRELLDSETVQTKVVREIIRDLKMIGAIKTPTSTSMSAGKFMTDAPSGKGKLIYIDNPDVVHGKRQQHEQGLSKPGDIERPAGGRRRRVRAKGRGPDTDPQDGE